MSDRTAAKDQSETHSPSDRLLHEYVDYVTANQAFSGTCFDTLVRSYVRCVPYFSDNVSTVRIKLKP